MGQNVKRMVSNDGWVLQRGSFIQGHVGQNVRRVVSNDGWVLQRGSFIQGHVGQNIRRVVLKDECFFYGGVPLDRDM